MANVRNTVTDTYQGETIECAQFVIDTVNQYGEALFTTCSIKEDGYYAFQMIAKASTNNTPITVQIANNTVEFTLTDQWAKYENIVQCQYNTSEPMANKLIFYFPLGTFYMYHSKLEKGNKITDWSENSDFTNETIETVWSQATQTATQMSWIIASGTSSTNFTLTNRTAQLVANFINLNGLVTIGAINDSVLSAFLGEFTLNFMANYSSAINPRDLALYCYSKKSLKGYTTFGDWGGSVNLGLMADYAVWTSTMKNYMPTGRLIVYHVYDTTVLESTKKYHVDFWKYNDIWYQATYTVSDPYTLTVTFTQNVKNYLRQRSSGLPCIAICKLSKPSSSSGTIYLQSVTPTVSSYYYDKDIDDFVPQNTKSSLGSKLGKLCSDANMTIIDGGKIATGSIEADKINVNSLESLSANIGGFKIENNNIECDTDTDTDNPSIYLKRYNENTPYTYGESSYTYPSQRHLQNGYIETAVSPNHDYCMPYQHEIFRNADGEIWTCAYGDSVKALANITWEDYESGLTGANSTTRKYIDPNGDYRIETDASLHVRITTGGEITLAQDGYNYPGQAQRATPFRLLDIYCEEVNINNKEVWTAGNLLCGKHTFGTISAGADSTTTITKPTSQIGSDPVVTVTANNNAFRTYASVTTSGTNTIVTIGVKNMTQSAMGVTVSYMIAKNS